MQETHCWSKVKGQFVIMPKLLPGIINQFVNFPQFSCYIEKASYLNNKSTPVCTTFTHIGISDKGFFNVHLDSLGLAVI